MASSAKHTKKQKKRKQKKAKKTGSRPARKQPIDLTLRLNVELSQRQGKQRAQPRRERVKHIRSRKRQNLREMRQSLPGAGGPQAFANPAFYGNVKMLTDSAMNQFQNKRYAIENQLRESAAEQKALQLAGRQEAAQHQGNEVAALQAQLADTVKMFTGVVAHQAGQKGHLEGAAQGQEQAAIEKADEEAALSKTRQRGEEWLKQQGAELVAQRWEGFTPKAIKTQKFGETQDLMVRALTFGRDEDIEALQDAYDQTARVKMLRKAQRTPAPEPAPQPEEESFSTPGLFDD